MAIDSGEQSILISDRLAELFLLVFIFAHFQFVHFFDQQFNYHSSFVFACRQIKQSAVERDVFVLQEPV
jgi:hypothetical protein